MTTAELAALAAGIMQSVRVALANGPESFRDIREGALMEAFNAAERMHWELEQAA